MISYGIYAKYEPLYLCKQCTEKVEPQLGCQY